MTTARPPQPREHSVLVVDDDAMMRILVERTLKSEGFRVSSATGGKDARLLLNKLGETLDLLLTDIAMPGEMGTDLGAEVQRTHHRTKVLYMSRYTLPELRTHGIEPGTIPIITKPFMPAQLVAKVREVLNR